jgi:uncharacterized membrane protein YgcG
MKYPNPGCGRIGYRSYDGYCSLTCANAHRKPQNKKVVEDTSDINYWVRNAAIMSMDNVFDGGSFNSAPDTSSDFSGGGGSFDGGGSSGEW